MAAAHSPNGHEGVTQAGGALGASVPRPATHTRTGAVPRARRTGAHHAQSRAVAVAVVAVQAGVGRLRSRSARPWPSSGGRTASGRIAGAARPLHLLPDPSQGGSACASSGHARPGQPAAWPSACRRAVRRRERVEAVAPDRGDRRSRQRHLDIRRGMRGASAPSAAGVCSSGGRARRRRRAAQSAPACRGGTFAGVWRPAAAAAAGAGAVAPVAGRPRRGAAEHVDHRGQIA